MSYQKTHDHACLHLCLVTMATAYHCSWSVPRIANNVMLALVDRANSSFTNS